MDNFNIDIEPQTHNINITQGEPINISVTEENVLINRVIEEKRINFDGTVVKVDANYPQALEAARIATEKAEEAKEVVEGFDDHAAEKILEYDANATSKTADFNTNATNKTTAFNTNASDKTTAFDDNASSKTADFNTNATNKTNAFNQNATDKTTAFNENYTEKKAIIDSQVDLAKDWATKTDGTVDGTDYSAKYWAQTILPLAEDITTVASISSDVTTVADSIADVNSVATDILKVTAVADDLTNIDAVNANKTNIDAVAGNNSNITAVANNATNINAVAGNETNINAVNTNKTNIDTVAGISTDVTSVANNNTDISAVASDLTNIGNVASDLTNINSVATNITNVNAVAGNATNINAVNSNKTNIDTVAGNTSDISTVAGISSDVSTVAGISSDILAVESNATDISTVATNVADIVAVAGDLTNINNASTYADNANIWAEGTDAQVQALGGVHSSKGWADQAAQWQVQANWNETDTSAKSYIQNKPTQLSAFTDNITTSTYSASGTAPVNGTAVASAISDLTTKTYVDNADSSLQSQIDALVVSSDVFDVVGTYAELQAYNISTVPVNDIIKVLVDSTHDNAATYYRCVESGGVKSWSYIGAEGAYYTKSEADSRFQATLVSGTNIKTVGGTTLLGSGDIALPTVNNATLTIQKNSTNVATFTANASSNVTANISVPTDTGDLTNNAGFITGITSSDVTTALGYTPYSSSNPSGYQANVIETVKVNGTALTPTNKAVDVSVPTKTSDLNNDDGFITGITSSDVTTALGYTPYDSSNPSGYTDNVGTVTSVNNTQPVNGNVTLSIPTVNNATLTITQGGTTKGTFTANASSDVTIALDSGGGSSYTAGTGIDITNNMISVTSPTLTNTATGTDSLTINGVATTVLKRAINIGALSQVTSNGGIAIGYSSKVDNGVCIGNSSAATWSHCTAIGKNAQAVASFAIQLGYGTNSEANSFYVGTSSSNNWKLLGSDGKIPSGRLPIATSVSSSSTNDETVGAKLFYDTCGDIETLINAL